MKPDPEVFRKILLNAHQALQRGERHIARRWAERAVELEPDSEEAWLILAAVASPRASINYLQQALDINPNSQRAQKGMLWALDRLNRQQSQPPPSQAIAQPVIPPQPVSQELTPLLQDSHQPEAAPTAQAPKSSARRVRWSFLSLFLVAVCVTAAWVFWPGSASPVLAFLRAPLAAPGIAGILADVIKPTDTPLSTVTPTALPTETFTPLPTSTDTPLPTDTPTPTATPTATPLPTDTATPLPTDTPVPSPTSSPAAPVVSSAGGGVRWIDVDLSTQMLYAYEGNTVVNSFLVSTGVSAHPTVTGKFHIYVKYLYTLMHGDGYYLPNVPYTMYFYKSYGIHGTYWHHNFGQRMSHGCVNMYTPDAEWLYYWASVGTLVNVHY
jgi:lipoprotein-anchoring transpeptidase ErfK/SrfK